MSEGGTAPAVLNAANEVAVASFLSGASQFMDIPDVVGGCAGCAREHGGG